MNSLGKNAFYSILKSVTSIAFPLVTFSYASRVLLPDGMGQIEFSQSYVAYFTFLAMLGIVNYGTREGAKVRESRAELSRLARELLAINLAAVLISCGILGITVLCIPKLSDYTVLLLIYSLTVPLTAIGLEWLYNAVEDYRYIAVRTAAVQLVSLLLMVVLVKRREDLWKYAAIQVLATTGSNILNFFHARKYVSLKPAGGIRRLSPQRHMKPVFLLFGMSVFIQVFTHMDSTMLGFMAGDKYVGLYAASLKMTRAVSSLITALSLVAMPRIAYYVEQKRVGEIRKLSVRMINLILMLGIPAMVGMIMLSGDLIRLFCGPGYMEADMAAKVMSLRVLLVPLNSFIVLHLFIPLGWEQHNMVSTGSAALLNLIVNAILIPQFYHLGAGVATVLAEGIELVVNLYFLAAFLNVRKVFALTWEYVAASVPIVFLCWMIGSAVPSAWLATTLSVAASVPAYFLVLLLLRNRFLVDGFNQLVTKRGKQ